MLHGPTWWNCRQWCDIESTTPVVFFPAWLQHSATIAALTMVSIRQRPFPTVGNINGFWAYYTDLSSFISKHLMQKVQLFSTSPSNGIILLIFLVILLAEPSITYRHLRRIYRKSEGGFENSCPDHTYLVGLLVAISLLRNSGLLNLCWMASNNYL